MREIEFRGYAKEKLTGSQWITGYGISRIEWSDGTKSIWLSTSHGDYEVYEESVGQYTGLKDSKGNKIYEGDILHIKSNQCWGCPLGTDLYFKVVFEEYNPQNNTATEYIGFWAKYKELFFSISYLVGTDKAKVVGNAFKQGEMCN